MISIYIYINYLIKNIYYQIITYKKTADTYFLYVIENVYKLTFTIIPEFRFQIKKIYQGVQYGIYTYMSSL